MQECKEFHVVVVTRYASEKQPKVYQSVYRNTDMLLKHTITPVISITTKVLRSRCGLKLNYYNRSKTK